MDGEQRRKAIVSRLETSKEPVSGQALAKEFQVSRQVIVQDVALIRANGAEIFSTHKGYVLQKKGDATRVFKVIHGDDDVEKEFSIIVDLGGRVLDVFVYHKVYNVVKASLEINSRLDIAKYLEGIKSGKSSLLKNVTGGYHYHTVAAPSEQLLDLIQNQLADCGFLAPLQDYEPVDFWKDKDCQNL